MKKYFAKYIVVPEQPKEGDLIQREWYPPTRDFERIITINKDDIQSLSEKKVKLFLCSKDIQPGDTFIDNVGRVWKNAQECDAKVARELNEIKSDYGICYKIIGEISESAIWVKGGDEFDKDDLCADGLGPNWDSSYTSTKYFKFKIKGPCGQWH